MRVICIECGALGRINKTNQLSENVAHLYCQCTDTECGHRWVSTLGYSRTISPSRRNVGAAMAAILQGLTREQKLALTDELRQQLAVEQQTEQKDKNNPIYRRR